MIRVALYIKSKEESLKTRALINRYAVSEGIENIDHVTTDSYAKFQSLHKSVRKNLIDISLCQIDQLDEIEDREAILEMLSNLMQCTPKTRFILMSANPQNAIEAYKLGGSFLELPVTPQSFLRIIGKALKDAASEQRRPFALKTPKGVETFNLNDVSFIETNKKGPIVHLPNERLISTKGTLQALYDRFNDKNDQFIRAGGSFVVNLDNVRSIGESSIVFGDGETIILPIRARKPVRLAYNSYLTGSNSVA